MTTTVSRSITLAIKETRPEEIAVIAYFCGLVKALTGREITEHNYGITAAVRKKSKR
jgi:hypothetical protein